MKKALLTSLILLIPLALFYVVEKYYGLMWGAVVAVGASVIEAGVMYIKDRKLDTFSVINVVLISAMAGVSLWLNSDVFIKLKPAIIEFFMAALFFGSSMLGKPFLAIMAEKQTRQKVRSEFRKKLLAGLNIRVGVLFLIHGGLTVYSALAMSNEAWIFIKGVLFYILFGVYFLGEMLYIRLYLGPKYARNTEIRKDRVLRKL